MLLHWRDLRGHLVQFLHVTDNMSRGASVTFLKRQQDQGLNSGCLSVQRFSLTSPFSTPNTITGNLSRLAMKFSSVYNNGLFRLQTSPPQATCLVSRPQTPWGLSSPALYVCCRIIKNPLHKNSSLTMASESGKCLEEQELYPSVDILYLSLLALITVFVFSFFLLQKNLCWQQ